MGTTLPKSDILIEYSSAELSLNGAGRFAFPRGITILSKNISIQYVDLGIAVLNGKVLALQG